MILSGQLGTAQLGLAQLGRFQFAAVLVTGVFPLVGDGPAVEEPKKKRKKRKRVKVVIGSESRPESARHLPPSVTPIRPVETLPVPQHITEAIARGINEAEAEARRLTELIQEEDELMALGVL